MCLPMLAEFVAGHFDQTPRIFCKYKLRWSSLSASCRFSAGCRFIHTHTHITHICRQCHCVHLIAWSCDWAVHLRFYTRTSRLACTCDHCKLNDLSCGVWVWCFVCVCACMCVRGCTCVWTCFPSHANSLCAKSVACILSHRDSDCELDWTEVPCMVIVDIW